VWPHADTDAVVAPPRTETPTMSYADRITQAIESYVDIRVHDVLLNIGGRYNFVHAQIIDARTELHKELRRAFSANEIAGIHKLYCQIADRIDEHLLRSPR
jgi:hypothetical protein